MEHQPHITDYQVLAETEAMALSISVEHALSGGWQPFGPLAISVLASDQGMPITTYAQAMVKQAEWFR